MMKKLFVAMLLLAFIPISIYRANAQQTVAYDNTPKIAAKLSIAALAGVINPSVEFRLQKHFSIQFESFGAFCKNGFLWTKVPVTIGATWLEGRYYIKEVFKGFYAGPNVGWSVFRLSKGIAPAYWGTYPNEYQMGANFMAGLTIGWHFSFSEHWGCELSWGGGYQLAWYEGHRASDGSMYVGWNQSAEWLPAYKAAINVIYKW